MRDQNFLIEYLCINVHAWQMTFKHMKLEKLCHIMSNTWNYCKFFLFSVLLSKICAYSQIFCAIMRLHDCSFYKLCIRATLRPLVGVWFKSTDTIPSVQVCTMSPSLCHEPKSVPWAKIYTMSISLYNKSNSITWIQVYAML